MLESISEILVDMVVEQLSIEKDKVTLDAKLIGDLQADSLDVVELVMNVEERFGIEIEETAASQLETIQDVVDYIENIND